MADAPFSVQVHWDKAGLARLDRYFESHQGRALERTIDKAIGKAVRPLVGKLKSAETASGIHNRTKRHYRSIKARKPRKRPGEVSAWTVGPTDAKRHPLIRGHRIVTPGGRDTGQRSRAFPYVAPVIDAEAAQLQQQLSSDVWASSIRSL